MYLLCATQSLAKCISAGITWNYFKVDPFFFLLFCFHSVSFAMFWVCRYSTWPQMKEKKLLFWQVCSMFIFIPIYRVVCMTRAMATTAAAMVWICFHLPIWCKSTINSIFRLMVVIQTAQVIATNCIFFSWCCACFWNRKTSGSIVNDA